MQSLRFLRGELVWGVSALVMAAVVALAVTLVYVTPPAEKTVSFYTDDAASIQRGDTVRIAGIIVGKVKDLSIEPQQVRVRAMVDRDAFVGDQSQVQVRMLTVVGGYYVNLVSLGNAPLGSQSIPVERVTMPYSLIRTLTDATKITDNVAPKPIKESLDQLQHSLTGTNVNSVTELIKAGNAMTDVLDRQRGQLSTILALSDEYIQRLGSYRGQLQDMIRKVAILEETLTIYGKGFAGAMQGMGQLVLSLKPVADFYFNHRTDFLDKLTGWQDTFRMWADRSGLIVRILRRVRDRMEGAVDAQNDTPPELLATDLCIPVPGSAC
jgi:phospholipid/cholesterol/gamma-HCH transport system substrate-binding protein